MKKRILQYRLIFVGGLLGAAGGYLYWKFWGCMNGCSITSSPRNSSIYFMLVGMLIFSIFKTNRNGNEK